MTKCLSDFAIKTVTNTASFLEIHAQSIVSIFYKILFEKYPSTRNIFNEAHFNENSSGELGSQPLALANALVAYASNIQNLESLTSFLSLVAHKHVALGVLPEHYSLVGECLLLAIAQVIGVQDSSEDILKGWKEAYEYLAEILSDVESKLREENLQKKDFWSGFTPFKVIKKEMETKQICSFYLQAIELKSLPSFKAGQYVTLFFEKEAIGKDFDARRNYSLSSRPELNFYRVSVNKESSRKGSFHGVISHHLHNNVDVGSIIHVGMPMGSFIIQSRKNRICLIAGGIGCTPLISMLDDLMETPDKGIPPSVTYIQCCQNEENFPLIAHINLQSEKYENLSSYAVYSRSKADVNSEYRHIRVCSQVGRICKDSLASMVPDSFSNIDFYICGSKTFQLHLKEILKDAKNLYWEYFEPSV